MRHFTRAGIKLRDKFKKDKNIQMAECLKKKTEQKQENEEAFIFNSTKISAQLVVEYLVSSPNRF